MELKRKISQESKKQLALLILFSLLTQRLLSLLHSGRTGGIFSAGGKIESLDQGTVGTAEGGG